MGSPRPDSLKTDSLKTDNLWTDNLRTDSPSPGRSKIGTRWNNGFRDGGA